MLSPESPLAFLRSGSMNTVSKGDSFEDEVFTLFEKLLLAGQLWFKPECAQIFRKKQYFSKDRSDYIVVDISIETYSAGADQWSILTVIECKNYTHNVPVNDIEEFSAKLSQIAGHNVKGIVATSFAFQKGSISFAKSKGIALVRILPSKDVFWDLRRRSKEKMTTTHIARKAFEIEHALTDPKYSNMSVRTFALIDDHLTHSLDEVLQLLHKQSIKRGVIPESVATAARTSVAAADEVSFLDNDHLERAANDLVARSALKGGQITTATDLGPICRFLESSTGVSFDNDTDLGTDARGYHILGKIVSLPPTIKVSSAIKGDLERSRFTLAHEIGHLVLGHLEYLNQESFSDRQYESTDVVLDAEKFIKRMEIQANKFAAFLLLPRSAFLNQLSSIVEMLQINPRASYVLYVDDQPCNQQAFHRVTGSLKKTFKVSKRVVEYHLKNLGLLTDERRLAI